MLQVALSVHLMRDRHGTVSAKLKKIPIPSPLLVAGELSPVVDFSLRFMHREQQISSTR
jgi:hypothetical protein